MENRVVAPTRVKGLILRLTFRAARPLPTIQDRKKSSIAEYRTSSTTRLSRWTSSMKSTSPGWRLVRMAAMSPARSTAGPEVTRMATSISVAMMLASVVFPRPGGP